MNKVIDAYYRENYDALVKRLSYRLGTRENAEDTVQEAFTRAVKYYESCSVDFDRWFKVLLANAVKDAQGDIRTAGLTKSIDDATDELEPIIPNHIKDLFRDHMGALSKTKPSFNTEVIRLNILFGYTPREISEQLNLSINVVTNNLVAFTKEVKEIYG
jgi:RNA polymerase sigma factor (sigma-70 family)